MRRHTLESDFTALRKIDIREEIAEAPLSWFHFRLAGLIALVVFFDGYNTSNASYVIHYVMGAWHLTPSEAGFLVSSGLIGFMVGAVVQGKASDRFGRRVTLIGSLWIVSVFSLLTALLARSFAPFCILRFLTGLGLGTLLPLGITYMNEFAPRRQLNSFSTWGWLLGFAGGGVAASAVGLWLTPRYGWEILNYAGSLAIVPTIACRFLLPESIKFSALQGDRAAVSEMLSRLIPGNSTLYRSTGVTFLLPESNENPGAIGLLVSRQCNYGRLTSDLVVRVLHSLCDLWPHRLGAFRDACAWREFLDQFYLWSLRFREPDLSAHSHAASWRTDGSDAGVP